LTLLDRGVNLQFVSLQVVDLKHEPTALAIIATTLIGTSFSLGALAVLDVNCSGNLRPGDDLVAQPIFSKTSWMQGAS